ncbi:MAG: HlyD family secretion protein [Cyanobacteria bacterium]|nr:HlyD family secretion protein [Cyanobacteriota bacterium]
MEETQLAGRLVAELERDFDGLRRLADAKVVVHVSEPPPIANNNRRWMGVALGAVVLLSTWGLGASNRTASADSAASLNGAEFTGTIKPSQRATLTSTPGGTVQKVLVAVGDNVTAGQPLIEIDDPAARATLDSARLDYQAASTEAAHWQRSIANLDQSIRDINTAFAQSIGALSVAQRQAEQVPARQFRDSPERAQAAFDYESTKLQRMQKLHAQKLLSDEQLDEQMTAVRIAQNDLENARRWQTASAELQRAQQDQAQQQIARSRADFQQMRADYVARLAQAQTRALQAQQRVDAAERAIADTVLRASTAGVVVDVTVDVGSRLTSGAPIVTIAKLNELLVEVPISPKLVNILKVGEPVTITLPTMPAEQVEGRIASINPIPAPNMTHTVEVEFANASGHLLTGQRAQVIFR